jgi:hypothetical protein
MSSEMSRPEHQILQRRIPEGHAHLDQKLDKGMRSPMVNQLPMDFGLEQPELDVDNGGGY